MSFERTTVRNWDDPEHALNSIVEAAKNGFDKGLVLEKVPRGVSESKGEIERVVQTIQF